MRLGENPETWQDSTRRRKPAMPHLKGERRKNGTVHSPRIPNGVGLALLGENRKNGFASLPGVWFLKTGLQFWPPR